MTQALKDNIRYLSTRPHNKIFKLKCRPSFQNGCHIVFQISGVYYYAYKVHKVAKVVIIDTSGHSDSSGHSERSSAVHGGQTRWGEIISVIIGL